MRRCKVHHDLNNKYKNMNPKGSFACEMKRNAVLANVLYTVT